MALKRALSGAFIDFDQVNRHQAPWFSCWVRVPSCGRLRLPQIFC